MVILSSQKWEDLLGVFNHSFAGNAVDNCFIFKYRPSIDFSEIESSLIFCVLILMYPEWQRFCQFCFQLVEHAFQFSNGKR